MLPDPSVLLSTRTTPRIQRLYAVLTEQDGVEGVVRRDTPIGTQAWVSDDPALAMQMLAQARADYGAECYLATFTREG